MKVGVLMICLVFIFHYSNPLREDSSSTTKRKVNKNKRVVCYYSSWAVNRQNDSKFMPEDIHPNLCTHILYAFATLDNNEGVLPSDFNRDIGLGGYAKFTERKKLNPELQVMLSVGGTMEGSARFSKIVSDPKMRKIFARNARSLLEEYGFDGLDIDWHYPGYFEGSSISDKENYVKLVKEIKEEFKDDFLLSMTVPNHMDLIMTGFDLPELSKSLDFMNVLNYNYHTASEPTVNHLAPLYAIPSDPTNKHWNVDFTIRTYLMMGVDPAKLNMGIPLYAVSYALEDPKKTDIGAKVDGEGLARQEFGSGIYNDFCKKIRDEKWTVVHANKTAMGPYAFKDNMWIAYDDEDIIRQKGKYAADKKLGGLMFWSIDMDDFKGLCHTKVFPLIRAGRESFLHDPDSPIRHIPKPNASMSI